MSHRLSTSVILPLLLYFLVAVNTSQITSFGARQASVTPTVLPTITALTPTNALPTVTATGTPVAPTAGTSLTPGAWFLELLKILTAWPVILGVVLWVFRTPLTKFLSDMGQRATKISIAQFSVELPESHGPPDIWTGSQLTEALQVSPIADSGVKTLIDQFKNNASFDHFIVDIELGQKWLTSRLFLFTAMLPRMNGLRCVVFLYTKDKKPRTFLGVAHVEQLRWVLAQKYPWLEAAYTAAYAETSPKPNNSGGPVFVDQYVRSDTGALDPETASKIATRFLTAIQVHAEGPPPAPPLAIQALGGEWEILNRKPPKLPVWERGRWLTEERLRSELRSVLTTAAYVKDLPDVSSTKKQKAIVNRPGRFVALVNEEHIFQELIDRQTLLEKIGRRLSEPVDD